MCGPGMLGRENWMSGVALAPQFLSPNALCAPDQSLGRTQIPSSTEASSPGPRDAPRPLLAIAGARDPRAPDTANPRQFPCPVHLWLVGREAQPTSGRQRSPRAGGQCTAHPWPAAEESATHLWPATSRTEHSLPLVGGGVPGPRQARALHRLVAEGAVVVDAAHFPWALQLQEATGAARVGRGTSRTGAWRSLQHWLSRLTDPGTALLARGVPSWDLKGPSLIPDCQTLCSDWGLLE